MRSPARHRSHPTSRRLAIRAPRVDGTGASYGGMKYLSRIFFWRRRLSSATLIARHPRSISGGDLAPAGPVSTLPGASLDGGASSARMAARPSPESGPRPRPRTAMPLPHALADARAFVFDAYGT